MDFADSPAVPVVANAIRASAASDSLNTRAWGTVAWLTTAPTVTPVARSARPRSPAQVGGGACISSHQRTKNRLAPVSIQRVASVSRTRCLNASAAMHRTRDLGFAARRSGATFEDSRPARFRRTSSSKRRPPAGPIQPTPVNGSSARRGPPNLANLGKRRVRVRPVHPGVQPQERTRRGCADIVVSSAREKDDVSGRCPVRTDAEGASALQASDHA